MMEAKLREIDPNELSGAELQFEISKCTRLKQTLASRLPDGGARLDRYLTRLHDALNEKTQTTSSHFPPKTAPRSESFSSKLTLKKCDSVVGSMESPDVIDADSTELYESQISDVDALSKRISSLDIQSDPQSSSSDSDTTCIGTLDSHEVAQILYTLNLPSLSLTSIQWFIIALRFSGQFVHLVVFDCESSDRYLFRTGLRAIWFPGSPKCKSTEQPTQPGGDSYSWPQLCSPAEALRDLWHFVVSSNRTTKRSSSQLPVPCLISCSQTTPDQLVWLSRLLRTTRHSSLARSSMPRDCRFLDLSAPLQRDTSACAVQETELNFKTKLVDECRSVSQQLFIPAEQGAPKLKPRNYSTTEEFLRAGKVRSLPWMEAPLELHILRQLKTSCALINETTAMPLRRPSLESLPDSILRRLASVGLGRTRLTRLAGLYGWQGFSGLLSFKLTNNSDSRDETARPFVTNSLDVVQVLYRFFRHVYDHLSRHLRLHMGEDKIHFKRNTLGSEPFDHSAMTTETKTSAQGKLLAWTAGGNTMLDPAGNRHSQCLDMDRSIELMQKVQRQFQEARVKHSLPSYPPLPSPSIKLGRLIQRNDKEKASVETSCEHQSGARG
ncbi:hypothetical protein CSKR_200226 [Clonorchis sinensis]|uniref:Uncharacterized protein n=1 Tax=Clonorchis sinensis TaxID=79923 RepID=A0A8T1M0T4_CLOSI|nr:hypothetical protein CSKR_200226 [Clonorchis sinensis]